LIDHINTCRTNYWQHDGCNEYVAAYTTMVQSSGVGKTLLAIKMLEKEFGIYICLRPKQSTGYPPRTPVLADYLLSDVMGTGHYFREFNFNVITELNRWIGDKGPVKSDTKDALIARWNQHISTALVQGQLCIPVSNGKKVCPDLPRGMKEKFCILMILILCFESINTYDSVCRHLAICCGPR